MNKKKSIFGGTVGVGYISIMLIFTVICLTILAVLSFQAVYSNNRVSERSEQFTQQYYDADMSAKKTLSELDKIAMEALDGFSFEESFAASAAQLDGVQTVVTQGGVRVDYSAEINERQTLSVSVMFYSNPAGNRYDILKWKSGTENIEQDSHPSVWDGGDLV